MEWSKKLDAKYPLHSPHLSDVASGKGSSLNYYATPFEKSEALKSGLAANFRVGEVDVVECPDFTQKPYNLTAPGICGSPRIADVGGPGNLVPITRKDKIFDLKEICETAQLRNGFAIGPGAGPYHKVGVNCEVLHVRAQHRIGNENFVSCMRRALATKYGNTPVGLGGVFLIKNGKAKLHIMGHNLRMEHTHCFSDHGEGGHYHYDVTPDIIDYEGYFVLAEQVYRIDRV